MSTQSDQPRAVFISYCTQDSDAAQTLCSLLEERGIPCWIAPRNITPGKEYGEEIINALEAAQALVLVMSESALSTPIPRTTSATSRAFCGDIRIYFPTAFDSIVLLLNMSLQEQYVSDYFLTFLSDAWP